MEEIKHFTVKELSSMVGIPQRRIQFYLLQNLITPDLKVSSGRGIAHKFSFNNVVELFFIKELNDMGVTLSVIKKIFDVYLRKSKTIGSKKITVRQFLLSQNNSWLDDLKRMFNSYFLISQTESGVEVEHILDKTGDGEGLLKRLAHKKGAIIINLGNIIGYIHAYSTE